MNDKKHPDYIVWNKESRKVIGVGTKVEMEDLREKFNKRYQTDAFVVKSYED